MTDFPVYNEAVGDSIISIKFTPFNQDDSKLFRRFLDLWFKLADRQAKGGFAPEEFILSVVKDNCLALDESSDSISAKWIAELTKNKIWSALINESPFKLSVEKVLIMNIGPLYLFIIYMYIFYRFNWTSSNSNVPTLLIIESHLRIIPKGNV